MEKPPTQLKDFMHPSTGAAADRRTGVRYPCQIPALVSTPQGQLAGEILSLSGGGLSLRCSGQLERGEQVQVASTRQHPGFDDRPLACQVEWASRASVARLSFQEPVDHLQQSWLAAELDELGAKAWDLRQRRGGVRVRCQIPAQLEHGGEHRQATLLDLGTLGARVQCPGDPFPEQAELSLRFGPRDSLPEVIVKARLVTTHNLEASHYGVIFTGLESGAPKDLLAYMNQAFLAKRSLEPREV